MKKRFLACVVLLICASFAVNGTLAYFTGEKIVHNVITSGSVDIELVEMAENDKGELVPFENVDGVMPGQSISKIPYVTNLGAEAWVRIKLDMKMELAGEGEADLSLVALDLNTADWTEKDGYYYYNKSVKTGESTTALFTTVTYKPEMGNLYQNSKLTLDVSAQATQFANNGTSALTAAGWPEPTT